ncbi:MAG: hypothetical protein ACRCXB_33570 [Aeromonadaceae bacterium]
MIDLDEIERACNFLMATGRNNHMPTKMSAEVTKELITRLRQAEKDAARWRFLADSPHGSLTLRIHNSATSHRDSVIDEAMNASNN